MMTIVRVEFDSDEPKDEIRYERLHERIDLFRKLMGRGVQPWKIDEETLYDKYGSNRGSKLTFYVNEFYEKIVLDLLRLDEGNDAWMEQFKMKHKLHA